MESIKRRLDQLVEAAYNVLAFVDQSEGSMGAVRAKELQVALANPMSQIERQILEAAFERGQSPNLKNQAELDQLCQEYAASATQS